MTDATNNAEKPRGRPFQPGNPGGPGRPEGSRNKATLALDGIADGEAEAVLRKTIAAAKDGDLRACELILSRVWPARKGRPVSLALPDATNAAGVSLALARVIEAVGAGEITTDEAQGIAAVLETRRRAIELIEIETRLAALEARAA